MTIALLAGSQTPKNQPIARAHRLCQGDDASVTFTVTTDAGAAVDITAMTFEWVWREHEEDPDKVLNYTVGAGIVLTTPASGLMTITIPSADTGPLPAGRYLHWLRRIDAGSEKVWAYGTVELLPAGQAA